MEEKQPQVTIDAKDQVLGRLACNIANILRGKNKTDFAPNRVTGAKIIVYNAKHVKLTGRKMDQKTYIWHTGWPGGYRERKIKDVLARNPNDVLLHAVKGMLPKNRLQSKYLKNLKIYARELK